MSILDGRDDILSPAAPKLELRDFDKPHQVRKLIYGNVLHAARNIRPLTNQSHTLTLTNVDYDEPGEYSKQEQKRAILSGESLGRRLKGTWTLADTKTGEVLDSRRQTIAKVPYYTNRGTFIHRGNEYHLINQLRLRPGIYHRVKENGELEAHVNLMPGTGPAHRLYLDPAKESFYMRLHQAKIPLMPLLRAMGATDSQLNDAWGRDLLAANYAHDDPNALRKLYDKLHLRRVNDPETPPGKAVADAFRNMSIDPEVAEATLGKPYGKLDLDTLLASTKKLIAINRGEQEIDDRDHLAYQTFMGPEDLLAERVAKDSGGIQRRLLWQSSFARKLKTTPGALNVQLEQGLLGSGLGNTPEEVNPSEMLDKQTRLTRMGQGGLSSLDAVPSETRNVQPSHLGFIDLVRTPESSRAGIDLNLASAVKKGNDGRIYAPFVDVHTGQTIYRTPQDVQNMAIAFPGEMSRPGKRVMVLHNGRIGYMPKSQVRYTLPHFEHSFSHLANLVALKSGMKGQRMAMASRMLAQALPLVQGQAPLVQAAAPGTNQSFHELYGEHLGALRAKKAGQVTAVSPDGITIRHADGTETTEELYNNFPLARKSVTGSTPIIIRRKSGRRLRFCIANYIAAKGDQILSVDPVTKRSAWLPITGFLSHKNDKKLVRVTTESGRSVDVTIDHSLVTIGDDGSLVPIFPRECVPGRTRLPVALLPHEHLYEVPVRFGSDYEMGIIAGLYLSEGSVLKTKNGNDQWVSIAVMPVKRARQVIALVEKLGLRYRWEPGNYVAFKSREICDWLRADFGSGAREKHISVKSLGYSSRFLCGLLAGYFAGDGCLTVDKGKPTLEAFSVSKRLRDGLMEVLAGFGIFTTKRISPRHNPRWGDAYGLCVIRSHIARLPCWFFYNDRETKLRRLLPKDFRAAVFDGIPVTRKARKILYKGHPSRPSMYIYKTVCNGYVSRKRILDNRSSFGDWARSDVMWDPVVSVTPIPHEELVYDFEVAASEVFAVDQGLIVHNTNFHQTPLVRVGDQVAPGHLLARSNYTDDKGRVALGLNARVAYVPMAGATFEDAIGISESMAKRLSSEHQYSHTVDWGENIKHGKRDYIGLFPDKYDHNQLETLDDEGIIKPGTRIEYGHPLILAAEQKQSGYNKVHRRNEAGHSDRTLTWDHSTPGVVSDVHKDKNGVTVLVNTAMPMQVADKLSNIFGGKGVIAKIFPDEQMPKTKDGQPIEVLLNPLGIISRGNPGQIVEAALGKIAAKTGQAYVISDFDNIPDLAGFAEQELKKHGLSDTEDLTDPLTGQKIPQVLVGNSHFLKLHHTAESKVQSRGTGAYTASDQPAKGGFEGGRAKRVAMLDSNALLSAGAYNVLRDAKILRGQRNEDYWLSFMQGHTPPEPKAPMVYDKFLNELRGAGINVVPDGPRLHLMALTDKDVDELAGPRNLRSSETVHGDRSLKPIAGGLFDEGLTGGHNGTRWSALQLHEPFPSPVMEDPIRRVLGLTKNHFEEILSGKKELKGRTGPQAIGRALQAINLDKEIATAREQLRGSRKGARDTAKRKLGYLLSAQKLGIHPGDWMLSRVPVLPPRFRPISLMSDTGTPLVSDPNYLYRELFDANQNLREMTSQVDNVGDERLAVYHAMKAVTGLGDPLHPKLQEKRVKGLLAHIIGSSPKFGCYDEKTEILTQDGWVRFRDLPEDVPVATLNPNSGAFEWQTPTAYQRYRYQGELIQIRAGRRSNRKNAATRIDLLVTPGHRNWVRKRNKALSNDNMETGWEFEAAYLTAASGGRIWFRTAASSWSGHNAKPSFVKGSAEDFAELVGWWVAEGWIHTDGKIVHLTQERVRNKKYCKRIDKILRRLGFRTTRHSYSNRSKKGKVCKYHVWNIFSPELVEWLSKHCGRGARRKKLSRHIKGWDAPLLARLLRGYLSGDGSKRYVAVVQHTQKTTHKHRSRVTDHHDQFNTTSKRLFGDLEELCCKIGVTVRPGAGRPAQGKWAKQYRGCVNGQRFAVTEGRHRKKIVPYDGYVYCCTVPNGIVLVRRNGLPVFCGNSVQRQLLSTTTDLVGRSVIAPNPDLDMDHIGIPEQQAWDLYKNFVVRRLKRRGLSLVRAMEEVKGQSPLARQELVDEMAERPIVANRAPVLHRFGIMAFYPKLTAGDVLQISPLIVKGFGADFDGDQMNFHVPVSEQAKSEAIDRMLPSRNLLSPADFQTPVHGPINEMVGGLYYSTTARNHRPATRFRSVQDALNALHRGDISAGDLVDIDG